MRSCMFLTSVHAPTWRSIRDVSQAYSHTVRNGMPSMGQASQNRIDAEFINSGSAMMRAQLRELSIFTIIELP